MPKVPPSKPVHSCTGVVASVACMEETICVQTSTCVVIFDRAVGSQLRERLHLFAHEEA